MLSHLSMGYTAVVLINGRASMEALNAIIVAFHKNQRCGGWRVGIHTLLLDDCPSRQLVTMLIGSYRG